MVQKPSDMARRKQGTLFHKKGLLNAGSKTRKALAWLLFTLLALALAAMAGAFQLLSWVQGDGFRQKLADSLRNKAQAESINIPANLQLEGNQLTLPSIGIKRADVLQQAMARRLTAAVNRGELLDRKLHITKMNMEEVSLHLDTDCLHAPLPPVKPAQDSFWNRFTPQQTVLDLLECSDVDLELVHKGNLYSLIGCNLVAAPFPKQKKSWQISLENGRFHNPLPSLQNCSIKNANFVWSPARLHVEECLIMLNPGELRLSGSYQMKGGQWNTEWRASKAHVARLLSPDWKKRLSGELYGTLKLSGKGGQLRKGSGTLALKEGILEGLPVLSSLPFSNTPSYRSLSLEKAECRMSYPYAEPEHNISNAWLFDQIDIRSQGGHLLVRGHVIAGADGSLGGTLTVGLPEHAIAALPLPESSLGSIFNGKGEDGYRWLNINLSGTLNAPQEDLSVRLSTILKSLLPHAAGSASDLLNNLLSSKARASKDAPSPSAPDEPDQPGDNSLPATDAPDLPDMQEPAGMIENAGQLFGKGLKNLF